MRLILPEPVPSQPIQYDLILLFSLKYTLLYQHTGTQNRQKAENQIYKLFFDRIRQIPLNVTKVLRTVLENQNKQNIYV